MDSEGGPPGDIPLFLLYVQDRDLWEWKLKDSKAYNAALSLVDRDFQVWSDLIDDFEAPAVQRALLAQGNALLKQIERVVRGQAQVVQYRTIRGYDAAVVNATAHRSELGAYLLRENPTVEVAAIWYERADGTKNWSLRSRRDFDCSVIAKAFGGGGHPQACGFTERPVAEVV